MKKEAKIKKSNKTLAVVLIVAAFVLILSLTIAFFISSSVEPEELIEENINITEEVPEQETPVPATNQTTNTTTTTSSGDSRSSGGGGGGGTCTPDCTNKECGDDRCGGSCGECDAGYQCIEGACEPAACENDAGCTSENIFCDNNIPYNCTLTDGCLKRTNLTECNENMICINNSGCENIIECTANQECINLTSDYCEGTTLTHNEGVCDNGQCGVNVSVTEECNDGLWCNGIETCENRECAGGSAPQCSDNVDCTDDSCNETTDSCDNIPDDTNCAAGETCTLNGCVGGCTPDCTNKECGDDRCGGSCPPGCGTGEYCSEGQCLTTDYDCFREDIKCVDDSGGYEYSTINSALDESVEGDTIVVYPGTYYESMDLTLRNNLTFVGADINDPPVLEGADPDFNPDWEHVEGYIYKTPYVFEGGKITDEQFKEVAGGESANDVPLQVWEDEIMLRGTRNKEDPDYWANGICINTGEPCPYGNPGHYETLDDLDPQKDNAPVPPEYIKADMKIPGRFMYDEDAQELYVWSGGEDNPENHDYKIPEIIHFFRLDRSSHITIRNFIMKHSEGYAIYSRFSDNIVIEDNFLVNNLFPIMITELSHHAEVKRNFIQNRGFWEKFWYNDCKSTIMWIASVYIMDSKDIEISNNVLTNSYAISRIRGNRVKFHDNIASKAMSIHFNFDAADSSEPGDLEVYHNIFHDVDDNSAGLSNMLGGPVYIYRNLFYKCTRMTKEGQTNQEITLDKSYIYHNTFALFTRITHHPYAYPVYKNIVYRNNIFASRSGLYDDDYFWVYLQKSPDNDWDFFPFDNGPDSDYNIYWELNSPEESSIAVFSYTREHEGVTTKVYSKGDFAQLQQETGLEPHGMQESPDFVNQQELVSSEIRSIKYDYLSDMDYRDLIGNYEQTFDHHFQQIMNEFRVNPDSPAINAGTSLPELPDVVEVRDGYPDMGAIEYDFQEAHSLSFWEWLKDFLS
jgi:hypothetical protein